MNSALEIVRARHLQQSGRPADAALLLRQATVCCPADGGPYHHLALLVRPVAEPGLVERLIARAVQCAPHDAEAQSNLALNRTEQGRLDEGASGALRALLLNPGYGNAYNNLGRTYKERALPALAILQFRRAAVLLPGQAMGWVNCGDALKSSERIDLAIIANHTALAVDPGSSAALNNLGDLLQGMGRLEEAAALLRHALLLRPDYAAAHLNLGMTLLRAGALEEGWRHYDWWRRMIRVTPGVRLPPESRWSGQDLAGRTLLLRGEQGLGDVLQFARYAPLFAERGARVLFEAPKPLMALLSTLPGVAGIVPEGGTPPPFDYHLPMMMAPMLLGTRLETIPAAIPYLRADPAKAAAWRERLAALPGLKVGLVWGGNPRQHDPDASLVDRRRSVALERLRPLLELPGISFVSLQKGAPAAQLAVLPPVLRPFDAMDEIEDFADTAALAVTLDLVISVDTSVAHLAGALGIPVWILSRFDGCWRWLRDRDDSPWYPAARLFRQPQPGDWSEVVARVGQALVRLRDVPRR